MEGVSVIICCHNSSARLPATLAHLADQQFVTNVPWEVIVVDNVSSDNTGKVATAEWAKHNVNVELRVVSEANLGLSAARRRGISEAHFDTLILCDDDNWLNPDYVSVAFGLMKDGTIGAVGGIGEPNFEGSEPSWFRFMKSFYAVGDQAGSRHSEISNFQYLYGAGMVVSKKAITSLFESGFSNATTDRRGSTLVSGGDTEISFALQLKGYPVVCSDQLKFIHFISADRLTLGYCNRLILGIGYSSEMLYPYRQMFDISLKRPFPTFSSLSVVSVRVLKSGVVLLLPFYRYGKFFDKWRVFLFEMGRLKFHILKQKYFPLAGGEMSS